MKKMLFTLIAVLLTTLQSAQAMSYEQARNEALFLTDKMAYELNLSDAQYEAAYEINLDYLMSVTGYGDVHGLCWERRNADLRFILYSWQWDMFCAATYFFRPLYWDAGYWHFGIYARYPRRDYFYFGRPHFYASYRGGHSWRLNGGRSYYEHRRDVFRPGHVSRDHHIGMRNGWDRGDYRSSAHGNSSTRVTAPDSRSTGSRSNGGWHINGGSRNVGGSRNSSGNYGSSSRNVDGSRNSSGNYGSSSRNVGGSRNSDGNYGSSSRNVGGSRNSNGHYSSGSRSSGRSNSGGSYGSSSRNSGGGYSGGSHRGTTTRGSGSEGGSRSGSSRR